MRDHLRSARLRYTAMTEDDLPLLATWDLDGATLRQLDSGPGVPRNVTQLGEWMRGSQARKDGYLFALRPLDSDEMLGYIELDGIQWSHGVTWFSILIGDPANRGKGYGSEALEWLLRFAFHELNLYRVQLSVFAYNSAAIRVYERAGFQLEGRFREFLARDGQRHDMLLYGILRPEWEARQGPHAAQPSGAESSGA